uniref:Uncharacterized protein n=1 Tax=Arundo donax TaxID=35708 RepID=A0A0A8Z0E9_ARUDO
MATCHHRCPKNSNPVLGFINGISSNSLSTLLRSQPGKDQAAPA